MIGEYIDRALTGTKDSRPDFQRMIADAANEQFEMVIVWKLDRFARNRYDSAVYKAKLKKHGVRVVSVMERITDSPEGIILEGLLESMAEYYSANLSENTKRGKRETALKGYWNGGHPPFGYRLQDRKLVADEKTAPTVRYIFEQYAAGVSKQDLIAELEKKGVLTYYGRPLTLASFNSVLRNQAYIGKSTYKGEVVEGLSEPLIDEKTFWKVQEQIKARSRAPAARKAKVDYLLSGKAFCGICGQPMVGIGGTSRSKHVYHYYRCSHRKHPYDCRKKNERKDTVEQFVVEQTLRFVLTPEQMDYISKAVVAEYKKEFSVSQVQELRSAIGRIEIEIEKLVDAAIEAPKIARQKMYDRMEALEAQKADLEESATRLSVASRIALTEKEVLAWMKQFCDGDAGDEAFRKRIIDVFVNSVYLYDDKTVIFYNIRGGKQVSFHDVKTALDDESRAESECSYLNTIASTRGFEPPTYRLGGGRSILLSYADLSRIWLGLPCFILHLSIRCMLCFGFLASVR